MGLLDDIVPKLKPYVLGWIRDVQASSIGAHDLSGSLHTGTIADSQAPQFLKVDGSRDLLGNLIVASGITIDGVDISAHASNISAHHEPVTILDTATINFGLSGQQVTGSVLPAGVDHDSLKNYVADKHIAHSTVSILAGDGLTGGGTLAANRTFDVGAGTGITVAADTVGINLAANLTWTGSHIFQGGLTTRSILPELTDTYDLGSSSLLWRKGWLSELDTVLFAQNTITLLGGWLMISKDEGALPVDITNVQTTIDFGKAMTPDDFVIFRASLKVEYMKVGTLVSGTTYNVTRNLDGSGADSWVAGAPFAVLGQSGAGRIELNAYDTPRISILEQGATYNAQTERIRIGDLASWQSAGLTGYGMAIGDYAGNEFLAYSPSGGLVVRGTIRADDGYLKNLTVNGLLDLDTTGELRAGDLTNGLRFGYLTDGYYLRGVGGGNTQVEIKASDGKLYAGAGNVSLDKTGMSLQTSLQTYYPTVDENSVIRFKYGSEELAAIFDYYITTPRIDDRLIVSKKITGSGYGAKGVTITATETDGSRYASLILEDSLYPSPGQLSASLSVKTSSVDNKITVSNYGIFMRNPVSFAVSDTYEAAISDSYLKLHNLKNTPVFLRSDGGKVPVTPCPPWVAMRSYSDILSSYCPLYVVGSVMHDESYLGRHLTASTSSSVAVLNKDETISDYLLYYRSNGSVYYSNATQGTVLNSNTNFAVVMWFKPTTIDILQGLFQFGSTTANCLAYITTGNKVVFEAITTVGTEQIISDNSVNLNAWNYIILRFRKNGLSYVNLNGTLTNSNPSKNGNLVAASGEFRLGQQVSYAGYFSGVLGFYALANPQTDITLQTWVDMSRPWHGH